MNSCFPSHLLKWVWERTKENAKCPCFFWNYALYIFLAFKYIMRVYVSGKKLWSMDSSLFYKVWFLSLQHRVRECQDKLLEIDIPGKQKIHLIQCFAGFSTEAVTPVMVVTVSVTTVKVLKCKQQTNFFGIHLFQLRLLLRRMMLAAWSMFHRLQCIIVASLVNYVPAKSLET